LTEEIEAVQTMLDRVAKLSSGSLERQSALDRAKSRLRSASGTKRSFKMEIRLVQSVDSRRRYEARLASLDQQLQTLSADIKALESESNRGELFVSSLGGNANNNGNDFDGKDGVKAGDSMLKEASSLQDKTQESLMNTKSRIAESKEVGVSTLEELERQRDVINNIEKETDRIDDNLARAEALLKQFGKRMASDHFIQCFALINCLLLLGVVLYAILKGGGLTGSGSGTPPNPTTTTTTTGKRFLLRRNDYDYTT
jgi:novel plant SNARE